MRFKDKVVIVTGGGGKIGTVLFLASSDRDFTTGQLLVVNGGTHLL